MFLFLDFSPLAFVARLKTVEKLKVKNPINNIDKRTKN